MEKLNLIELNLLYYCVGKVRNIEEVKMISDEECEGLIRKLWDMIEEKGKDIGR